METISSSSFLSIKNSYSPLYRESFRLKICARHRVDPNFFPPLFKNSLSWLSSREICHFNQGASRIDTAVFSEGSFALLPSQKLLSLSLQITLESFLLPLSLSNSSPNSYFVSTRVKGWDLSIVTGWSNSFFGSSKPQTKKESHKHLLDTFNICHLCWDITNITLLETLLRT